MKIATWIKSFLIAVTLTTMIFVSNGFAQEGEIIRNDSGEDLVYATIKDLAGNTTAELSMGPGEEAILSAEGKLIYGTGLHQLINLDGKGQYVTFARSSAADIFLMGFYLDSVKFHFEEDATGAYQIIVDEVANHDLQIDIANLTSEQITTAAYRSISIKNGLIILEDVSDFPFVDYK